MAYKEADSFMLCVAINDRETHQSISSFKTEILRNDPNASIILVGTKSDLRSEDENCVASEDLTALKDEHGF